MAETLGPGQGKELLALAKLDTDTEKHPSTDTCSNKEIVNNLKEIYDAYAVNRMPFVEQVRLLVLLPHLWSYEDIMQTFECSWHVIKTAHRMQDEKDYALKSENETSIRQRAAPNKIKHFVSWLVDSNTLMLGMLDFEVFFSMKVASVPHQLPSKSLIADEVAALKYNGFL